MENFIINGGNELRGSVKLQGSKNSILPILAASAVTGRVSVLHNCPVLSDVDAALEFLRYIGCKTQRHGHTVIVDSRDADGCEIPENLMREMRSSIIFLGALLARFGKAKMSAPGGCEIGLRPIDLHISALRSMGACITETGGVLECRCDDGLSGRHIALNFPSVGATENIILAAIGARGETVITNAAREPEIIDLAEYLNKCGVSVVGAGQSVVRITGGGKLCDTEHRIIPDRIVASTLMAGVACAGGKICIRNVVREHLAPVIPVLRRQDVKSALIAVSWKLSCEADREESGFCGQCLIRVFRRIRRRCLWRLPQGQTAQALSAKKYLKTDSDTYPSLSKWARISAFLAGQPS